ncbi:Uncharacterized protein Fot_09478 [Forsythia ovata]|uniref:Uncharacterized protein n=1 Tax=Forsythia ovata TaxID=205694 RepID=A0ABD1WE49_9LAMI
MTDDELQTTSLYVLLNCEEIIPFVSKMPVTRGGYKSGQASQEKSTHGGGKRSTRNDYGYSEANILNDELEDEYIDDAFHSEDMYRSNNRELRRLDKDIHLAEQVIGDQRKEVVHDLYEKIMDIKSLILPMMSWEMSI